MHVKKVPPNGSAPPLSKPPEPPRPQPPRPSYSSMPTRRGEPDLSHLATRKVDTVSSLAAEMMLRQADEEAAASSPPSPTPSPAPLRVSSPPPPAWSTVRPARERPGAEHARAGTSGGARIALLVAGGLLLVLMSAAAAFVLTR